MTTTTPESRGRIAYTTYGKAVDFTNHRNEPLPTFDALYPQQQRGWINAAQVIWDLATTGRAVIE